MALTTKEQLKQVLDAVFNNGNPDTEYINSANTPSIKMYLNEITKHANILEREDDIDKYIVAILQTENHPYLNEGEVEYFSCKDIKDAILTTVDDLKEYNRGVSSYIPMKRYIQNIGVFLGVSIADNIDEVQPLYYQDMVDIVKKYCTLNNKGLAYWGRYDVSGTATYKSYVPVMCLVDIAIYLNELRVFSSKKEVFDISMPYSVICFSDTVKLFPKLSDIYNFQSKSEYIKKVKARFKLNPSYYTYFDILFEEFLIEYENDVDWNNNYVVINTYGSYFECVELPRSCIVLSDYGYGTGAYVGNKGMNYGIYSVSSNYQKEAKYVFNAYEDYIRVRYVVNYNTTTQEFTNNKTITNRTKNTTGYTEVLSSGGYSNIKNSKYIKQYTSFNRLYSGSYTTIYYNLASSYDYLRGNTVYNNLNFLNYNEFITGGFNFNYSTAVQLLKYDLNVEFSNNDLVIIYKVYNNGDKYRITIIRDAKNVGISSTSSWHTGLGSGLVDKWRYSDNQNWNEITPCMAMYASSGEAIPLGGSRTFTFSEQVNYETYDFSSWWSNTPVLLDSGTVSQFEISEGTDFRCGLLCTNLGSIETVVEEDFEGITTISGSTYPSSVIDVSSFISTYSGATYRTLSNPYYENDELVVTNLHTDTWVACNVTKNIPVDQNSAQNPNVDDLTDDDVKDVLKDIDDSTDNKDDEDDPLSDDETNPGENEGNNTIPTINDVFKYNMSQFETQWILNEAEFQALGLLINSTDFLNVIALKIAGILGIDPLSGIVSVQVAPVSLTPNIDTTLKTMVIRGMEMSGEVKFLDTGTRTVTVQGYTLTENVKEFDLGEKDISTYFNSYMDLVDTQMTLYLPFIGNIDLDIRDFYDGSIWIKGFVESFTGQIVYYIIAKKENQTRIVSTVTGNCYSTIPLNQDSYGSIMNSFTRG